MNKLMSRICATALAVSFAASAFTPAQAIPMSPSKIETASDIVQVNHRRWRQSGRYYRDYDGYRGDRYYRRHNGGAAAAIIAGALITGAIINSQQPRRVYRNYGGNSHISWCYNRYRSYRDWDNTFQPYNGPRRLCYSPFY